MGISITTNKISFNRLNIFEYPQLHEKSLINETVITSSWNPKSNPTLWKKQGYFRNIYKAN